ncbi:MAG: hypothetical protein LBR10_08810 [Prevotellaceae bacterium]|jgi:hypothetical protein|nr:hypothetical protein [Prevotellaceae bacterium]
MKSKKHYLLLILSVAVISTVSVVNLTLNNSRNNFLNYASLETVEALTQEIVVVIQKSASICISAGPDIILPTGMPCFATLCQTTNVSCSGNGRYDCIQGTHITDCATVNICQYT